MTTVPIQNTVPRRQYTAAAGQTDFPFDFWIAAAEDLAVFVNGTIKSLGTDYTIATVQSPDGSTVTFTSPLQSGDVVTLVRAIELQRVTEFQEAGTFKASALNLELSRLMAISQELRRDIDRKAGATETSQADFSALSLPDPADGRFLVWDGTHGALKNSDVAAAGVAADAQTASVSAAAAAHSEANASASAVQAADSAAAAAASANSQMWRTIKYVSADYIVTGEDNGALIAVDTSGGDVVISLPQVAGLMLPDNIGVKKTTSDVGIVTITAYGSETIDGVTDAAVLSFKDAGQTFSAETSTAPNGWVSTRFGAVAGNPTYNTFISGTDTYPYTLTRALGLETNLDVWINGLHCAPSDYSIDGTSLSFANGEPASGAKVVTKAGSTLPIGVPSNGVAGGLAGFSTSDGSFQSVQLAGAMLYREGAHLGIREASEAEGIAGIATNSVMSPAATRAAMGAQLRTIAAARVDNTGMVFNYNEGFASISLVATGRYNLMFMDTQPDTNYIVQVTSTSMDDAINGYLYVGTYNRTITGFNVLTQGLSGGTAMAYTRSFDVVVFRKG